MPKSTATATARPPKGADVLIREAAKAKTGEGRLAKIVEARAAHKATEGDLRQATKEAIAAARADSIPWSAIGKTLGISSQRAEQLAR